MCDLAGHREYLRWIDPNGKDPRHLDLFLEWALFEVIETRRHLVSSVTRFTPFEILLGKDQGQLSGVVNAASVFESREEMVNVARANLKRKGDQMEVAFEKKQKRAIDAGTGVVSSGVCPGDFVRVKLPQVKKMKTNTIRYSTQVYRVNKVIGAKKTYVSLLNLETKRVEESKSLSEGVGCFLLFVDETINFLTLVFCIPMFASTPENFAVSTLKVIPTPEEYCWK